MFVGADRCSALVLRVDTASQVVLCYVTLHCVSSSDGSVVAQVTPVLLFTLMKILPFEQVSIS